MNAKTTVTRATVRVPVGIGRLVEVFCGCGDPEAAWRSVYAELKRVAVPHENRPHGTSDVSEVDGHWVVMAYLLAHLGLTEHGSNVRSAWLSPTGQEALDWLTTRMESDVEYDRLFPWCQESLEVPQWDEPGAGSALMIDVPSCGRCKGKHRLVFHAMRNPVPNDVVGMPPWTHWAPCPAGAGPILFNVLASSSGCTAGAAAAEEKVDG